MEASLFSGYIGVILGLCRESRKEMEATILKG